MKKLWIILAAMALSCILLLSACNSDGDNGDDNGDDSGRSGDTDDGGGAFTLGQTFEADGLEFTFSSNIGFIQHRTRYADDGHPYVFYIPTTIRNVGSASKEFLHFDLNAFSPNGMSVDILSSWDIEESNIFSVGAIRPGMTVEGNLYIMYAEDGEYIIEHTWYNFNLEAESPDDSLVVVEVKFDLIFDFSRIPEIKTQFSLGETLVIDGMEITFEDNFTWGTIRSSYSDNDGEHYFYLPVSLRNTSESAQGFPWDFDVFGPDGNAQDRYLWGIEGEDITGINDILPGTSTTGYLHVLYVGNGVYTLQFTDRMFGDDLQVSVPVKLDPDDLPVFQTEFTLGETFVFDELEITITDDFSWGTIDARFSPLHGETVFILPISVTNIGSSPNSFPWGIKRYGPSGLELDNVARYADEDVTDTGNILPGSTLNSYIHILYDGDGEYIIDLTNWNDTAMVIFNVAQ